MAHRARAKAKFDGRTRLPFVIVNMSDGQPQEMSLIDIRRPRVDVRMICRRAK
jgi:hypothetical protein